MCEAMEFVSTTFRLTSCGVKGDEKTISSKYLKLALAVYALVLTGLAVTAAVLQFLGSPEAKPMLSFLIAVALIGFAISLIVFYAKGGGRRHPPSE